MSVKLRSCMACGASLGEGLVCDYCDSRHVPMNEGYGLCCRTCGVANTPNARACTSCNAELLRGCPECHHRNPIAARFCGECRIELQAYKQAKVLQAEDRVGPDGVEAALKGWLDTGWFRARDTARVVVMDVDAHWCPVWRFTATAKGRVTGERSQTHYRTETRRVRKERRASDEVRIQPFPDFGAGFPKDEWEDRIESVPYQVWEAVEKDFERPVSRVTPAFDGPLAKVVGAPRSPLLPVEGDFAPATGEVLRPPASAQRSTRFDHEREGAIKHLKSTLLERVERLDLRLIQPQLQLIYIPVYTLIYRYKRSRKRAQINGSTRTVTGESVSLLSQWFG